MKDRVRLRRLGSTAFMRSIPPRGVVFDHVNEIETKTDSARLRNSAHRGTRRRPELLHVLQMTGEGSLAATGPDLATWIDATDGNAARQCRPESVREKWRSQ